MEKREPRALNGCGVCNQEAFDEIGNIIDLYKGKEGSLIQVLHKAQEIYGYLPLDLQSYIADGMGKSLSEVSGVVTFYPFFKTKPHGRHTISICMGTACYVRGGKKLVETLQEYAGHIRSARPRKTACSPLWWNAASAPAAGPRHHGGRHGLPRGGRGNAPGDQLKNTAKKR